MARATAPLLAPAPLVEADRPAGSAHEAIRALLRDRGASFWGDLVTAVGTADEATVLGALWDLVWAGEVTNDTFAPLRARRGTTRTRRRPGARVAPRPGSLRRAGPPAGAGRWSLVEALRQPVPAPTQVAHARAMQLLDRHGVVTRETALAEGIPGGYAAIYPVLRALEEAGQVRRGYFVAGLGAAQFAMPGAVDRLRAARDPAAAPEVRTLAAADPAQPFGAALPWPASEGRPARAAGAYVVLAGGGAAAFLERGGRTLLTFPGADAAAVADAIAGLVKDGRLRRLDLRRIDGEEPTDQPVADALRAIGATDGYRGLTLRA